MYLKCFVLGYQIQIEFSMMDCDLLRCGFYCSNLFISEYLDGQWPD